MPNAAETQAPLNDLLKGKVKGNYAITWTPEALQAFAKCKIQIAESALLAHPKAKANLSVTTNASDFAIGGIIQQEEEGGWKPLTFFSRKLSPAEQNYSAYDRELMTIYLTIKHYQHSLEGSNFTIYTDHKPIMFAFK